MLVIKRVRNIDALLEQFGEHKAVNVVFPNVQAQLKRLAELGFTVPLVVGETLLPAASFGKAARRNANGYEIVHRDQPKETRYHQIQWTWTERHGTDLVERTGIKDRPYYRYPRTRVPPYSIEISLQTNAAAEFVVTAGPLDATKSDERLALQNTIHMFVDLFGSCLLARSLQDAHQIVSRRLNWEILPHGEWPWERVKASIGQVIKRAKQNEQPVLQARFDALGAYRPTFTATGHGGFSRYIVHGWEPHGVYLLESMEVNNATYVLKDRWEAVSAMTKAQILHTNSHDSRLIHRQQWFEELDELMKRNGIRRNNEPKPS
jgi:hypothetical protein